MPTFLVDPTITIEYFQRHYQVAISHEFLACADAQLTDYFSRQTGLTFSKNLCASWVSPEAFYYDKAIVSKLPFLLFVNHHWNPVTVLWTSASGRLYDIRDTDIDCEDVTFWFEQLDTVEYYKQLYPSPASLFKPNNLSYELTVIRLNMDCTMRIVVKSEHVAAVPSLISKVYDYVEASIFLRKNRTARKESSIR